MNVNLWSTPFASDSGLIVSDEVYELNSTNWTFYLHSEYTMSYETFYIQLEYRDAYSANVSIEPFVQVRTRIT